MSDQPYIAIAAVLIPLSLVSFGGGLSVLPALQQQAVDIRHWVGNREFIELFAIARAAPGPGLMLATLLGWKVAGWCGALIATLSIFLPSSAVCLLVTRLWARQEGKAWHGVVQQGLAPVGTGLVGAGIISLFRIADAGPASWAVAATTGSIMLARPEVPPAMVLLAAGALFAASNLLLPA